MSSKRGTQALAKGHQLAGVDALLEGTFAGGHDRAAATKSACTTCQKAGTAAAVTAAGCSRGSLM